MTTDDVSAVVDADLMPVLVEAVARHDTPFYVLDLARVERRARSFGTGVGQALPHVACAYPFKANPMAAVTARAVGVYGRAEVATVEELQLATSCTIPAPTVFVGGIAKTTDTLVRAAAVGATIKIDSEAELERLRRVWSRVDDDGEWTVLLRIALPEGDGWSRFGLLPDDAVRVATSGEPWTRRLRGVHFHAGTALPDPAPFVDATRRCSPVLQAIGELDGIVRPCLDIGGGYPNVPDGDVEGTAARYVGAVAEALAGAGWEPEAVEVVCEPGRITVERAGLLVASVIEGAPRSAGCAVVVNAGSTLAGGSWAPVRAGRAVVFGDDPVRAATCDVYGNLCHEGDLVAEAAIVARAGGPPGTAVIGDVGAYRLSAAAPWMQQLPVVYEVRDGALAELRPALPLENFT